MVYVNVFLVGSNDVWFVCCFEFLFIFWFCLVNSKMYSLEIKKKKKKKVSIWIMCSIVFDENIYFDKIILIIIIRDILFGEVFLIILCMINI